MMERRDGRASGGRVAEARDQGMPFQPAVQLVAEPAFAFPVHDPHGPFAAHERALDERFGRGARLVPAQAVQVGLSHVAARFGQEQQAFERVGAWRA